MTEPSPLAPLSDSGDSMPDVVDRNVPCNHCGYVLRGLPISGRCPECGTPVAQSMRGRLLEHASPEFVAKLRRGLLIVVDCLGWTLVSAVAQIFFAFLGRGASASVPVLLWAQLAPFVSLGVSGLSLLGWWLFTSRDPSADPEAAEERSRRVVRITLVVTAALALVSAIGPLLAAQGAAGVRAPGATRVIHGTFGMLGIPGPAGTVPTFSVVDIVLLAAELGRLVAVIVQFIVTMQYIMLVTGRIPSRTLQLRARACQWQLPVIYVCGYLCCMVGPFISTLMYLLLLADIRIRLNQILRLQRGAQQAPRPAEAREYRPDPPS